MVLPVQIRNARVLTPFSQQEGSVLVVGDRIIEVSHSNEAPSGTQIIDAQGMYLVPGYIDLHLHAGGGHHVMEGTAQAIRAIGDAHAAEGTTTILPTTSAAPMELLLQVIDAVRMAQKTGISDASIGGIHLQGPFLSPAFLKEGVEHLRPPLEEDYQALLNQWPEGIRIMGISPELPGALALGELLAERGIVASISHSCANYDQVLSAVTHGFSDVSNPYTGCSMFHTEGNLRMPGVTESALAMDELTVQVAADGRKLPMTVLQVIYRCKGAENILLVTDAKLANPAPGEMPTMALLVRNMVAAGVSLRVALRMATVNPARRVGLDQTKGRIAPGYDADILLLDEALDVQFCMARGKILRNLTAEEPQARAEA